MKTLKADSLSFKGNHVGKKMAFINVYTPNSYILRFWIVWTAYFLEWTEFHLIIGTDMNAGQM